MSRKLAKQCGRRGEKVFSWVCLSPSIIGIMIFFILPFCMVIRYSLINNPIEEKYVGLENYKKIIDNEAFKTAVRNTRNFSMIAVPLAVVLSLGLAMLLNSKIPAKSVFRAFFLCPLMVPTASIVLIWQVMFHSQGTVNQLSEKFGYTPVDWLKDPKCHVVLITMFLWKNLGYNMILFMAALGNIPNDIMEVAELEGASAFYKFFRIKLRYLSPTIFFVTILSLINSFKIFREVYLLTGSYPFRDLYLIQHFMNNTFSKLDYQKLSTAAILFALAMIVIVGVLFLIERLYGKDVEE